MSSMHLATLFDCINCDYMQAKDIDEDVKKAIRKYEEVGFDAYHDYPTPKGGKKIPLIVQYGDSYTIQSTLTPALVETDYVAPVFNNDILAHNLASIDKTEPIVCCLEHLLPAPR